MNRMMPRAPLRNAGATLLALLLGGCATLGVEQAPGYQELFDQAEAELAAGEPDDARLAFARAARADPVRKEPWQRIAALDAQSGRPLQAMAAAAEVLQRDPGDAEAERAFLDGALAAAQQALARLDGGDAARLAPYGDAAAQLVATLVGLYGEEAIPAEVRERLARKAVEQFKSTRPIRREAPEKAPSDPLDVLGG